MAGVQQENGNGGRENRCVVGKQAYRQKLGRAGIHKQGHGKGPAQAVAFLTQKDAKADTQKKIAGHDGHGVQKDGFQRFMLHGFPSFLENGNRCTQPTILLEIITVSRE